MNNESSRGHVIFTIAVEEHAKFHSKIISELSCVDLAGRENEKNTTVTGDQLVELTFINKSLFHLANCISSLQHSHRGQVCKQGPQGNLVHGPKSNMAQFRNSKLTLLLSQAISGNSCTAIVGTLSPASCSRDETLRTLRFANSVRGIHLAASSSVRSQPMDMDVASHRQIEQFQAQLQTCKASLLASYLKLPLHLVETEKQHGSATTRSSLLSTALPSPGAASLTSPPISPRNICESARTPLETSRSYAKAEMSSRSCKAAKVTDQTQYEAMEETDPHADQFKCMEKQTYFVSSREPVIRQLMRLKRLADVSTSPVKTSPRDKCESTSLSLEDWEQSEQRRRVPLCTRSLSKESDDDSCREQVEAIML
jgi:hypothetical protein